MTSNPKGDGPADKAERLAAALRENLKRRKQQARGRASAGPAEEEGGAEKPAQSAKTLSAKP